jgi:sec-independent protein translocase protein TatA
MFGLGFGEIILVLVVALLVLGPEKLPKLAKQLGRGMREFRRAASDFQATLQDADPTRTNSRPKTPTKAPKGTIDANQALKEANTAEPAEAPKTTTQEQPEIKPEEQA